MSRGARYLGCLVVLLALQLSTAGDAAVGAVPRPPRVRGGVRDHRLSDWQAGAKAGGNDQPRRVARIRETGWGAPCLRGWRPRFHDYCRNPSADARVVEVEPWLMFRSLAPGALITACRVVPCPCETAGGPPAVGPMSLQD